MKVATLFTGLGGLDLGCARATSRAFDSTTAHFQQHPNSVSDSRAALRAPRTTLASAFLVELRRLQPCGLEIIFQVEHDERCAQVLRTQFPAPWPSSSSMPTSRRNGGARGHAPLARGGRRRRQGAREGRAELAARLPRRRARRARAGFPAPRHAARLLGRPRASRLASSVGHRRGSRCAPKTFSERVARLPPSRAATLERASAIHSAGSFFSLALSRTRPPPLADSASDPRSPTPRYPVITHPRDRLPSPRWSRNWKRSDTDGRTSSTSGAVPNRPANDANRTSPPTPPPFAHKPPRDPRRPPGASARAPPGSIFSPRAWTVRGTRKQSHFVFSALFFSRAPRRVCTPSDPRSRKPRLVRAPPSSRPQP